MTFANSTKITSPDVHASRMCAGCAVPHPPSCFITQSPLYGSKASLLRVIVYLAQIDMAVIMAQLTVPVIRVRKGFHLQVCALPGAPIKKGAENRPRIKNFVHLQPSIFFTMNRISLPVMEF